MNMDYSSLPLVSMESLMALEDSLEGQTVLSRGFVGRYVELWPSRFSRLNDAMASGNWGVAAESALSLFSASAMVGADRLGQMSGDLVEILKHGDQQQARDIIAAVGSCGNETVAKLTHSYLQQAP